MVLYTFKKLYFYIFSYTTKNIALVNKGLITIFNFFFDVILKIDLKHNS